MPPSCLLLVFSFRCFLLRLFFTRCFVNMRRVAVLFLCFVPLFAAAGGLVISPSGASVPSPVGTQSVQGSQMMFQIPGSGTPVYPSAFPGNSMPMANAPSYMKFTAPQSATDSNPAGYNPVMSGGAPVVESVMPVTVNAPAGGTPTASQLNSAAAIIGTAGAAAATGAMVLDVPLGGGAGSLAASLAGQALGVGSIAAAVAGAPVLAAGLGIGAGLVGVGMAGNALWNAMQSHGLSQAADGSLSSSVPSTSVPSGCASACFNVGQNSFTNGLLSEDSCSMSGTTCLLTYSVTQKGHDLIGWNFPATYGPNSVGTYAPLPPTVASATPQQVGDAIAAATADPAVALDAAALAIKNGVDMAAAINAGYAAAQATIKAIHLASQLAVQSSTVDSGGNTSSTLWRNVLDQPATSPGAAPQPAITQEKIPVVNGAPQSVTSTPQPVPPPPGAAPGFTTPTSLGPSIGAGVGAGIGAGIGSALGSDLCLLHPEILACADITNLSEFKDEPMPTKDLSITLTPVTVPGGASCPGGVSVGAGKVFEFTGTCEFARMIKPLLLAFAWLSAGGIVFAGRPYA